VRRLPGQAARGCARVLHLLAHVALTLTVLVAVLGAAAAWRLSQGPVRMDWLTQRLEAALNADDAPTQVAIGSSALAWEGFSRGVDRPLDLQLTDITVTAPSGRRQIDLPRVEVSLSLGALLQGRLEPRAIEVDGARITLRRGPDGTTSLDLGTLNEATDSTAPEPPAEAGPSPAEMLLRELVRPAADDRAPRDGPARGMFSQLRRILVRNAAVVVIDRQLGATWQAPEAEIDLVRRPAGGVDGTALLRLALGDQTATLTANAVLETGAERTHVRARLSPVAPAALARAAPRLERLSALDAPVTLEAAVDLDAALQPTRFHATATVGAGAVEVRGDRVALESAVMVVDGTPTLIRLETAQVAVQGHEGGPLTHLRAGGTLVRQFGQFQASVTLDLDQLAFADLPRLWPAATGGGARPWIVGNIPTGTARNGHVAAQVVGRDDFSEARITALTGTLDGQDLTVHWLRPVPPLEQVAAQLRLLDPDTLEIVLSAGRQRAGKAGLAVKSGRMRITGLSQRDQTAAIQADVAGSVPDTIALLKEPRLELLDKHPMPLGDPAGEATANLTVTLPLDNKVTMADVGIRVLGHLSGLHLGGLVAGRDLDQGDLDVDVTQEGMTAKGRAALAGIPADLDGMMDFRGGPPTQVVQRIAVTGRAGAGQLAAAGLSSADTVFGEVGLHAIYTQHRAGDAEVALDADLTPATLVAPTGWRKPVGMPAKGSALVRLDHDRLRAIDRITVEGDGLMLRGSATAANGRVVLVRLDRAVFGRNDLRGEVRLPPDGSIAAELSGATLDLAARLAARTPKEAPKPRAEASAPAKPRPEPAGPPWTLDARFDRVLLAGDQVATGLVAQVENDGRIMRRLHAAGRTGDTAPFQLDIGTDAAGPGRRLSATAADAGALLSGLDVVHGMAGGTLTLAGTYDDRAADHPLIGTAEIDGFRLHGLPALGKLLQAMTLYGMVDVLRGPGIGFTKLIAPFRYNGTVLTLNDARAFSASLGITAKGRIDLAAERVEMEGTIVPAYFFNSLLGHVPLIGKLFSPEKGGGVFAARYGLSGKLDDPSVSVNPLSALTPGFLREIFGIF